MLFFSSVADRSGWHSISVCLTFFGFCNHSNVVEIGQRRQLAIFEGIR